MTPKNPSSPDPSPDDGAIPPIEPKMKRFSELFDLLGADPQHDIQMIVEQTSLILESECALYHRLDGRRGISACRPGVDPPPGFPPQDAAVDSICRRISMQGCGRPLIIADASRDTGFQNDPHLARSGVKAVLGYPVQRNGRPFGALCIMDIRTRHFTRTDGYLIGALAKSLSLAEERREAETALRRKEEEQRRRYNMLRLIADNVPDLIWAKALDDRYLFVNRAVCDKLLKCKHPEEAVGKTDAYFARRERERGHRYTFGDTSTESDRITRHRKTAARFVESGLIRNERLVLDIHKGPYWGDDGSLAGTVGCGRDITREKHVLDALSENEKKHRECYNRTPAMIFSLDRENRVAGVSDLWLDTMGYARKEVLGRPVGAFMAAESRRAAGDFFSMLSTSGKLKKQPCRFVTKAAGEREMLINAVARCDAQGRYEGALAFLIDVTDAREVEKDQHLLTARLQQAQKMEAIATLAGGIAHQFNNALAVILGNIELIQMDDPSDGKMLRFIDPIHQAGQRMVQLTSQLLAYARGGKFQTQVVSSHRFVRETLSLVGHSLPAYVELKTELDESAAPIEVDNTQMQMLLAAILSNASEAIEKNGTVTVALRNTELTPEECLPYQGLRPGKYVLLQISDTGRGMDEQACTRIFEPFFTTKFQGRGLGMAAVYGIVKKHDGYIYVASRIGSGTTVSVFLPRADRPQAEAEEEPPAQTSRTGTALVIEDEDLVMQVSRAIVEKLGYRVLEARSGKEALHIAETYEGPIDFALLDVVLPDMSGNQIFPRMKQLLPQLKVIVCSGFTLDGPAREILNAGADSFLPKPFTMSALSTTLDTILKDRGEE